MPLERGLFYAPAREVLYFCAPAREVLYFCAPVREDFHASTLRDALFIFHTWSKLDLGEFEKRQSRSWSKRASRKRAFHISNPLEMLISNPGETCLLKEGFHISSPLEMLISNPGETCLSKEGFHTSTLGETLSFFHAWSKLNLGELESSSYDLGWSVPLERGLSSSRLVLPLALSEGIYFYHLRYIYTLLAEMFPPAFFRRYVYFRRYLVGCFSELNGSTGQTLAIFSDVCLYKQSRLIVPSLDHPLVKRMPLVWFHQLYEKAIILHFLSACAMFALLIFLWLLSTSLAYILLLTICLTISSNANFCVVKFHEWASATFPDACWYKSSRLIGRCLEWDYQLSEKRTF